MIERECAVCGGALGRRQRFFCSKDCYTQGGRGAGYSGRGASAAFEHPKAQDAYAVLDTQHGWVPGTALGYARNGDTEALLAPAHTMEAVRALEQSETGMLVKNKIIEATGWGSKHYIRHNRLWRAVRDGALSVWERPGRNGEWFTITDSDAEQRLKAEYAKPLKIEWREAKAPPSRLERLGALLREMGEEDLRNAEVVLKAERTRRQWQQEQRAAG